MPTRPKRPSKPAAKPTATQRVKPLAKAPPPSPKPLPSLRFYHSQSLRTKTLAVLTALEKAKDRTQHRGALAEIVVELTDAGMEYYFLRPLKVAKAGFFVEQSASLGIATTTGVLASVMRSIIGGMDDDQLLSVCSYIRQLMK